MPKKRNREPRPDSLQTLMLKEIRDNVHFLLNEISVNGSKGLENILRDHQNHFKKIDYQMTVLNDCTQYLQAKRKVRKVMAEYLFLHPNLAVMISFLTSWRIVVLVIIGLLIAFKIAEPDALKIISKLF